MLVYVLGNQTERRFAIHIRDSGSAMAGILSPSSVPYQADNSEQLSQWRSWRTGRLSPNPGGRRAPPNCGVAAIQQGAAVA
jgi:hypothetical protein